MKSVTKSKFIRKTAIFLLLIFTCSVFFVGCGHGDKEAIKHLQQAKRLKDRERYKEAIDEYRLIINKYPKSKYVKQAQSLIEEVKTDKTAKEEFSRASNSINEQDYLTAIEILESIVSQFPNTEHAELAQESIAVANTLHEAQQMYIEGRNFEKEKNFAKAIAIYNEIVEKFEPDNLFAKKANESIVTAGQEKERLDKKLTIQREKDQREARQAAAEKIFKRAEDLFDKKEFIQARKLYEKLVNNYQDSRWFNKSKNQIEHAITGQTDKQAKVMLDAGEALMQEHKYLQAIDTYQELLDTYNTSIWFKVAQQKISSAREALSKVEYDKALALEEAGKFEEAIAAYFDLFDMLPTTDFGKRAHSRKKELTAKLGAEKLFTQAESAYKKGNYGVTIDFGRKIAEDFPNSKLLSKAKEMIRNSEAGKLYRDAQKMKADKETKNMVSKFTEIVTSYQMTPWSDKAQEELDSYEEERSAKIYQEAKVSLDKNDFDKADSVFEKLRKEAKLPTWRKKAEEGLQLVYNRRIEQRFNTAEELFKKGEFGSALAAYQSIKTDFTDTKWGQMSEEGIDKSNNAIAGKLYNEALELFEQEGFARKKETLNKLETVQKKYPLTEFAQKAKEQEITIRGKSLLQELSDFLEKKEYIAVVDTYNRLQREQPNSEWHVQAKEKINADLSNMYLETVTLSKDPIFASYTKKVFQLIVDEFPDSEFAKKAASQL